MSTKKLLSGNEHRNSTMRRSQAVRELQRLGRTFGEGSSGRFRIDSLVATLEEVRKDGRFTSEQKDAKFRALLNRAR